MPSDDTEWGVLMEASLLALLEAADEGVLVFDRDGRCRMIGRRAGELFGLDPASHVGRPRDEVLRAISSSSDEPDMLIQTVGVQDLLEPPRVIAEIDVMRPKPRRIVWTSFPVVRNASVIARLVLLRDVTRERSAERQSKQLVARIEQLSPTDTLTGLLNQRRFREELDREHGRCSRTWDGYAVLRIDVDGMAEINDDFGVPVGDGVLEKVAECLKGTRREYDIVARLEADEFVALLPSADAVAAHAVAERFVNAVRRFDFGLTGRRVTISV